MDISSISQIKAREERFINQKIATISSGLSHIARLKIGAIVSLCLLSIATVFVLFKKTSRSLFFFTLSTALSILMGAIYLQRRKKFGSEVNQEISYLKLNTDSQDPQTILNVLKEHSRQIKELEEKQPEKNNDSQAWFNLLVNLSKEKKISPDFIQLVATMAGFKSTGTSYSTDQHTLTYDSTRQTLVHLENDKENLIDTVEKCQTFVYTHFSLTAKA